MNNYCNSNYVTKARWVSYWHQINEIVSLKPQTVLEIGIGNKVVSDYLKKSGIKVVMCDKDYHLKPDVVADVLYLPFKKDSFDVILVAEILEHLPFSKFSKALKEIKRVSKRWIVISLPDYDIFRFYLGLKFFPYVPKFEKTFKVNFPGKHKFDGEHYWEIGKKGYSLSRILKVFELNKLDVLKNYYSNENPYHRFFVLKK